MHGKNNIKFHIYIYIYKVDQQNAPRLNLIKFFTISSTYRIGSTIAEPWFDEPGCTIHVDIFRLLYCTWTFYNCFLEDEAAGSKYVHVADIAKH